MTVHYTYFNNWFYFFFSKRSEALCV